MRRYSLRLMIITLLMAIPLLYTGCASNESQPDDGDVSVSFNIDDPKIKERLGEDDGYAFAIFYGADIHGSLETCG